MKNRYQVLVKGSGEISNFDTKEEALQHIDKLKKEGKKATFWDTLDNDFTKALNDIFKG